MRLLLSDQKIGVLTSTAGVFISALLWLLGFKVVALWMGPEGVGLFSQLRQIAQAATIGATFGGTNPVVQGLAERPEELARLQFRASAARIAGISAIVVVSLMLAAAQAYLESQWLSQRPAPNSLWLSRWNVGQAG